MTTRPVERTDFRERCRRIVLSRKVWDRIQRECETDAKLALEVAAHGFGRPPQAIDLTSTTLNVNLTLVARLQDLPKDLLAGFIERGDWRELPPQGNA